MGKWTHLLGTYPEKKKALDKLKEFAKGLSMDALEHMVADKYKEQKDLKEQAAEAKQEYIAASEVLLELWEEDGTQSIKREHIGHLSRLDDVRASLPDIDAFKEWEKSQGLESLVYETINSNSLSSVMKRMLEEGEEIPQCVKLFIQSRVSVTNPKGVKK